MARRLGLRFVAVALVLGYWSGAEQAVAQAHPASVAVLMYNRAHMSQRTLYDGAEVGKGIFAQAGMTSVWIDCLAESSEQLQRCSAPEADLRLEITVIKRWKSPLSDDRRLGLALQNAPGYGIYCYVFEDKLDELVRDTHVNPARLLGSAMAHEIGHLLKGSNSHAAHGIMSAYWYRDEIEAVRRGALTFTPEDIAAMGTRLSVFSQSSRVVPVSKPRI
jgi:hypothetical protein